MSRFEDIDFGDDIDEATFEQILEMDEEDDREFSRGIVFGFLEQAESTFIKMDDAVQETDLKELAALGHFLKGSSATLGFNRIRDECEKIQHYGHKKDETGMHDEPDESKVLRLIQESLAEAKLAFHSVERLMHQFYAE